MSPASEALNLLPGTLDLQIFRSPACGRRHGYGIAEHLCSVSHDISCVAENSLYPALYRLPLNACAKAEWSV
jgi:DNA-binding PadR family transcriptional regulator